MDKPKSEVVKSKSISTSETKNNNQQKHNKKSRSNAEFKPLLLKKRGVYVEKKPVSINNRERSPGSDLAKQQSSCLRHLPPRPGRKRFVASVLSILSKSAAGTQCPDGTENFEKPINNPKVNRQEDVIKKLRLSSQEDVINKLRLSSQEDVINTQKVNRQEDVINKLRLSSQEDVINKQKLNSQEDVIKKLKVIRQEDVIQEDSTPAVKRKHRHRTKGISKSFNPEQPLPVVVLKSTKEITHTASSYSVVNNEDSVNNYLDRVNISKTKKMTQQVMNNYLNTAAVEDTKINMIEKINDPTTVAELTEAPNKDDKRIYNFFVDLLKTTFSVYNVQTEYKQPPPSSRNSSEVELEIDESVAKKLNIEAIHPSKETCGMCVSRKPSSEFNYSIRPDDRMQWDDNVLVNDYSPRSNKKYSEELPAKAAIKRKRRLKSESFSYRNTPNKKVLPNISSLATPDKKKSKKVPKKNLKRDFLNELRNQLQMKTEEFEEPQNFFEALKVIARNKKRCQKSIFNKASKKSSEGDVHVCQLKTRRVLSAKSSGKQSTNPENRYSRNVYPSYVKRRTPIIRIAETSDSESVHSDHSLTVSGYDYEPKNVIRVNKCDNDDFIMLPTNSTPDY